MNNNRRSQPLYLDPNDKMLGGVCSGLGHYFDVDTLLVRVGFVVATLLTSGGGALVYVILWALLDPAPTGEQPAPPMPEPPTVEDTIVTTTAQPVEHG